MNMLGSTTLARLTALAVVAAPICVQAQTPANQQVNTPAQAALGLYAAWYEGSYSQALQYATPDAVNQLFTHQNSRDWDFRGCKLIDCSFRTANGTITMRTESLLGTARQNFRVATINFRNPLVNSTPEDAALGLVRAWKANNRSVAQQFASPDVVNQMFGLRSGTNLTFEGCQGNSCLFPYYGGSVRLDTSSLLGAPVPNYRVTGMIIMNL